MGCTQPAGYAIRKNAGGKCPDPAGELVCLTVSRRGAREVVRRLARVTHENARQLRRRGIPAS